MNFTDSIREGFAIINRRWHLVLIRVGASVLNLAAFFVIVGIPLFIAIMVAGVEFAATSAGEFLTSLKGAFMRGYVWIAALVLASILLYALFAAFVWMYVVSGSMGMIARSLENRKEPFKLKLFYLEARKHFRPLANFYLALGALILGAFIVIGMAVGGAAYISDALKGANAFLGILLEILLDLFIALAALIAVFGSLNIGAYGAAVVVLDSEPAWASIKKSVDFLASHPWGFWGYSAMLIVYGTASFLLFVIGYPFRIIPIIGIIVILPYQLASYALERYLGLSLLGSAFSYYLRNTRTHIPEEAAAQAQAPAAPERPPQGGLPDPPQTAPPEGA